MFVVGGWWKWRRRVLLSRSKPLDTSVLIAAWTIKTRGRNCAVKIQKKNWLLLQLCLGDRFCLRSRRDFKAQPQWFHLQEGSLTHLQCWYPSSAPAGPLAESCHQQQLKRRFGDRAVNKICNAQLKQKLQRWQWLLWLLEKTKSLVARKLAQRCGTGDWPDPAHQNCKFLLLKGWTSFPRKIHQCTLRGCSRSKKKRKASKCFCSLPAILLRSTD